MATAALAIAIVALVLSLLTLLVLVGMGVFIKKVIRQGAIVMQKSQQKEE